MKLDRLFIPMFKELERIGKKITNNLNIKDMTREIDGAHYADSHPRWISVEEKLPNEKQKVFTINKVGFQDVRLFCGGKWYSKFGNEHGDITHWMPLPSVEHLKEKVL